MEWLNYHHLYYFAVIAEEGGVAAAARKLRLTHSTLSTQLMALERHFGVPLFERRGRRLVLTAFGVDAVGYAADIFRLGRELTDVAKGRTGSGRDVLRIGVVPGIPKALAHQLLGPALDQDGVQLLLVQDKGPALLEALVAGRLQLTIQNEIPVAPQGTRIHSRLLGETDILLYATTALARRAKLRFPQSLSSVPFVLPPTGAPLRRRLDAWFVANGVHPIVKAEADDAGLIRALGLGGRGVFPVRAAMRADIDNLPSVQLVGRCEGLRESYYAVSTERRIRHRGVVAVVEAGRAGLQIPQRKTDTIGRSERQATAGQPSPSSRAQTLESIAL